MDASLANTLVYAKTPKGVAEINARSGALTLQTRRVLIMIDGRRAISELMAVVRDGEFDGIMTALETQGMIERVEAAAPAPRNYEEDDFADTISLLQENAAALRAMPNVHPADVMQAAVQERPATIGAANARPVDATADAAAIAAQAVANAGAPHPGEPAPRRPPTVSVPMPSDITVGKARTATINTVARPAENARPVPPPPTVRAPLAAPSAPEQAGAAVATPLRAAAAAATVRESAAAPGPAPQASATAPGRSLEEEKRFVISELYSILGPYGEQSAAKLMECATMDALREQVKAAGKRVVTFRGEKASQDFLRAVGYA